MNFNTTLYAAFFDSLTTDSIYQYASNIVNDLYWLSGIFIVLFFLLGLVKEQYNGIVAKPDYNALISKLFVVVVVMLLYSFIASFVFGIIGIIRSAIGDYGNYHTVLEHLYNFAKYVNKMRAGNDSFIDISFGSLELLAGKYFYLRSMAFLTIIAILYRVLQALLVGVMLVWGLIAIPSSMLKSMDWSPGWTKILVFSFLWVFFEAVMLALLLSPFTMSFNSAFAALEAGDYSRAIEGDAYFILTAANYVIGCVIFITPILLTLLMNNQAFSSMIAAPFAGLAAITSSKLTLGAASAGKSKMMAAGSAGASALHTGGKLIGAGAKMGGKMLNKTAKAGKSGVGKVFGKSNNTSASATKAKDIPASTAKSNSASKVNAPIAKAKATKTRATSLTPQAHKIQQSFFNGKNMQDDDLAGESASTHSANPQEKVSKDDTESSAEKKLAAKKQRRGFFSNKKQDERRKRLGLSPKPKKTRPKGA